jgi:hypothetical protein
MRDAATSAVDKDFSATNRDFNPYHVFLQGEFS